MDVQVTIVRAWRGTDDRNRPVMRYEIDGVGESFATPLDSRLGQLLKDQINPPNGARAITFDPGQPTGFGIMEFKEGRWTVLPDPPEFSSPDG